MEGELCVDLDLEWSSSFDDLLVRFSFERIFMTLKQLLDNTLILLRQHLTALPIFLLRIPKFNDLPG